MNIILVGPPASGKGTQSQYICNHYNLTHISTGNLFRKAMKERTALGNKVKEFMDKGVLVPDEITVAVVKERLKEPDCENGVLFDGFPRTVFQAQELNKFFKIDYVILIDTDVNLLVERAEKRWVCPSCGAIYTKGVNYVDACVNCGTNVVKRKDDNRETVLNRFNEYEALTYPIVDYYKMQNLLYKVDGNKDREEVFERIKEVLDK